MLNSRNMRIENVETEVLYYPLHPEKTHSSKLSYD
jgi:hypothetical protein